MNPSVPRLYAVGDVHGDFVRLRELLLAAGLTDDADRWRGGESALVFTGDLTDRGNMGIETIRFVRGLQEAGADVEALMGNHDALILARAYEWRGQPADPDCRELFVLNGGRDREAKALSEDDGLFEWMRARPLMDLVGDVLFQHADSARFYRGLGADVEAVNAAGSRLAESGPGAWRLFYDMTSGREWDAQGVLTRLRAEGTVRDHLARFGAARVVHGHTPHKGSAPLVSFGGRAINVDGLLSEGYRRTPNRGFVADLGPL